MKYDTLHSDDESDHDLDIHPGELTSVAPHILPLQSMSDVDALGVGGRPSSSASSTTITANDIALDKADAEAEEEQKSTKPVAWKDLPRKKQLIIITLTRLSEPITQTSLQAYLFYQLKWFDPSLPDSTIASQSGIMTASFNVAQFLTAMMWGRLSETAGRKKVLLIGLFGTCLSTLGFGMSTTYWQALMFRTLGGALNGNIGVLRTMISEIIREKKYQSRAFLLLPMTFNIGVVIGPVLGGILSDPAGNYPSLFGGVAFLERFPYAVPNVVSSLFLLGAALAAWLGLEETLEEKKDQPDMGIKLGKKIMRWIRTGKSMVMGGYGGSRSHSGSDEVDEMEYSSVPTAEYEMTEGTLTPGSPASPVHPSSPSTPIKRTRRRYTQHLAFRRIFTRNVILTLITQFFLTVHIGTFNSLWFIFLSTPVWDPKTSEFPERHLPFQFTGGLGLKPKAVGTSLAVLGFIGISMQLFLFPRVSARLGTIRSLRIFLLCFPLSYFLVPYLSVVPSSSEPPAAKTGFAMWFSIFWVLFIQVTGRTFALPSQTILVNNCSPHPSVLGSVHGLGQSVASAARTIGPMLGGWVYGYGLNKGYVGMQWWVLSCDAVCCWLFSLLLREGDGHEIWLEGDDEDAP